MPIPRSVEFVSAVCLCFGVGALGGAAYLIDAGPERVALGADVEILSSADVEPAQAEQYTVLGEEAAVVDVALGGEGLEPTIVQFDDPLSARLRDVGDGPLDLTYAASLTVRVLDYADISGDYRVNDDETIAVPGVGRVSVAGRTGAELETILADRLIALTGRASTVTVEVDSYRGVFVSGAVEDPDSYEWTREMTVIQALALAGGPYRGPERLLGGGAAGASPRVALQQAQAQLKRALARYARLTAEFAADEVVATPSELVLLVGETEAAQLIAAEQALLDSNELSHTLQVEALEAALAGADEEVQRLIELELDLLEQLDARMEYFAQVERAQERGYVPVERVIELRGVISALEERVANARVALTRARSAQLAARRDQIELSEARLAGLSESLLELESQIETFQLTYDGALAAYRNFASIEAAAGGDQTAEDSLRFQIARRLGDEVITFDADRFDRLLPGDVVLISAGVGE